MGHFRNEREKSMTVKTLRKYFPQLTKQQAFELSEAISQGPKGHLQQTAHDAFWRVGDVMAVANRVLANFGTETVYRKRDGAPVLAYSNTGDSYDVTLVYDFTTHRFRCTSWGDWVERYERRGGKVY